MNAGTQFFSVRGALALVLSLALAQAVNADGEPKSAEGAKRSDVALVGYSNYILPPGTTADLAIANLGVNMRRCSDVEVDIRVLGTVTDPQLRSGPTEIEFLEKHTLRLAPGQSESVSFYQSSTESESIFFVAVTHPRFKRCLAQSPVALSVPSDSTFTYFPGSAAADQDIFNKSAVLDFALTGDTTF